ncbi:hypothetical protein [Dactylosporangium sp. NPDC049140]|uniref:hypothetical protein n=1 Tax=Dactylosporangium sp. NPDC049140 TaxID=3155647 RepID=UPI00340C4A18
MTVHDLAGRLPGIEELRAHCRALATLDAILCPEWESRLYSFDSRWSPGEEVASMRDGSGNDWFIAFGRGGAFMRGFDHESAMAGRLRPGVADAVPAVFTGFVHEPAFGFHDGGLRATFCLWRETADDRWRAGAVDFPPGADPDGSGHLCELLVDRTPEAYRRYAEDYFEVDADLSAIRRVYAHEPLTAGLVRALNPELTVADLEADVAEIGYR